MGAIVGAAGILALAGAVLALAAAIIYAAEAAGLCALALLLLGAVGSASTTSSRRRPR